MILGLLVIFVLYGYKTNHKQIIYLKIFTSECTNEYFNHLV